MQGSDRALGRTTSKKLFLREPSLFRVASGGNTAFRPWQTPHPKVSVRSLVAVSCDPALSKLFGLPRRIAGVSFLSCLAKQDGTPQCWCDRASLSWSMCHSHDRG